MDLPPSKLSSAASRVWNENAGLHKKTDVKIDIGLQPTTLASVTAENSTTEKVQTSISSGYVFGSRVFERVAKTNNSSDSTPTTSSNDGVSVNALNSKPLDVSSIFRRMAKKATDNSNARMWKIETATNGGGNVLSKDQLSESANELASKQGNQPATTADDQQPITTGEEEEQHLLQISCKFYHYNTESKQWQERGMGTLRVNQHIGAKDDVRLVGRQSGSQRVLINSKIFPEMLLEELSEKRLKISAHTGESDVPQLFLIQASPASIAKLQNILRFYIESSREFTKVQMHESGSTSTRKRRITDEREEEDSNDMKEWGNGEGAKKFLKERQSMEREEKEEAEEKEEDEEDEENAEDEEEE